MLDFAPVRKKEISLDELVDGLTVEDLRNMTNAIIDRQLEMIADCVDEDVVFEPEDKKAFDPYAKTKEEGRMPWSLGHLLVHVTASSEEAAYKAAELARGVEYRKGRSRYEVPWQTVTMIEQCRQRLEESRRMRLASLDMWPVPPHLENLFEGWDKKEHNAVFRFVLGVRHEDGHLDQIVDVVQQARESREGN